MKTSFKPKDEDKQQVIQRWLEVVDFTHKQIPAERLALEVEWGFIGQAPSADVDPEALVFTVGWRPSPVNAVSIRADYQIPEPVRNVFERMGVAERLLFVTALRRQMARNRISARLFIRKREEEQTPGIEANDGVNPLAPDFLAITSNIFVDEEGISRKDFFDELTRISSACAEASFMCDELGIRGTWTY